VWVCLRYVCKMCYERVRVTCVCVFYAPLRVCVIRESLCHVRMCVCYACVGVCVFGVCVCVCVGPIWEDLREALSYSAISSARV